ncbi:MAG: hypothetical protein RMJ53_03685, partial [Chitinophagales bacterium]|nr:hypothetical protein [Chitinophagales bacterium]MDW8273315.1 hypothetical protein [Chitinophagales bacterium]
YEIKVFNPVSNFWLSLGLNYPNERDEIVNKPPRGGDIYIHGKCVSAGCLAMEDEPIKEIYSVAILARSAGQRNIPVHIFPFRMKESIMNVYITRKPKYLVSFWKSIQKMYLYFEKNKKIASYSVKPDGSYEVEDVEVKE